VTRLSTARHKQSLSTFLRKALALPPVAIALLQRECVGMWPSTVHDVRSELAEFVNAIRFVDCHSSIVTCDSTAAVWLSKRNRRQFHDQAMPGYLIAGEMPRWEAPTGDICAASFATAMAAGPRGLKTGAPRN